MPNHVTNKLTILGTKEQVKEVFDFIKIEKSEENPNVYGMGTIDFNKITPMPKWVFSGILGREDEEKYGKENCWYDWCCKNWGTKWNAYGQPNKGNTENTICFETAWDGVPDLIQKLAWIFPNVIIEYSYSDEDFGYNVGKYRFRDTETLEEYLPVGGSKEAYELAFEVNGSTPEDYDMVFNKDINNYEYIE